MNKKGWHASLFKKRRTCPLIKKLSSLFLLIAILFGFSQVQTQATGDLDRYNYVSLYYENMDVKIDVTETGLVKINTVIDAQFNNRLHGIQVFLPQRYEMTFTDPETNYPTEKAYYWKVSNIQNKSNEDLDISTIENGVLRLRFGDPDIYVTGPMRYEYYYEVQTYDLDYKDLEMFYWNIVGTGHEVDTKNVTFEVTLPKPVTNPLYIHSGYYYSLDNEYVDYTFENNQVIKGHSVDGLPRGVGITAQVDVEPGYFDYPERPDYTMVGIGALGIGALVSFYWFIRHGRDGDIVITIEHEAPKDLSSAMVGYIYNDGASTKEVLSLIVEWASKGYLHIEEVSEDNMKLTKLKELPEDVVSYEARFFEDIFKNRTEVTTSELENKFYNQVSFATTGLTHYFKNKDRRLWNAKSNTFKVFSHILAGLLMAVFVGLIVYNRFFITNYGLFASVITFFIAEFFAIIQTLLYKDYTIQSKGKKIVDIILSLVTTAIFVAIYFVLMHIFGALDFRAFIAIVLYFIIVIATINMGQRTKYARQKLGNILGLRTFIEEADKERLELLVHDNPTYFYDVLPYAYVLGISDVWSKKFEGIAMPAPQGYTGSTFSPIYYTNNLNNMMHRTERSMTSVPAPKGSGGGGFGGGSFGGGGGGFSGGGFGGGGSGGW